jgi:hypothetical protein
MRTRRFPDPDRFDEKETNMQSGKSAGWFVCMLGAAIVAMPSASVCLASSPITVAVIDFDYSDTSGEPRDQTTEHASGLDAFVKALRGDLATTGQFKPVEIACASPPCTAKNTPAPALIAAAKAAGARLMVYGGIEKMSTLIQWGKLQIVDLQADRLIDDKMLTFPGRHRRRLAPGGALCRRGDQGSRPAQLIQAASRSSKLRSIARRARGHPP